MSKKILVVGGHMAPALGFIDALPKDISVVYVGRKHPFEGDQGTSLEYQTITKRNIPFIELQTGRLQRAFTFHTVPSLLKIPKGLLQAVGIIKKEKPNAVVSFGGYLSLPIAMAAKIFGIPLIIHESTFGAGLANKLLSPFATKICVSQDSSLAYFPNKKTVITGNPLLPFSKTMPPHYLPKSKEKLPLIAIIGGSAGSHAINALVMKSLGQLLSFARVIHQTGDAREYLDFDNIQKMVLGLEKKQQDRYVGIKYIDPQDVNSVLANADIVVSRAGFNTIMTLAALKKKSILIPFPFGQKDEQLENAKFFVNLGYGTILPQENITPETLIASVQKVLSQKVKEPQKFSIPLYLNGAKNLVREVLLCLRQTTDD